jgi:alkylated DNA nucleotide flippase Atl1
VRKAKLASWRKFVTSYGNSEAWGFVYKQQAEKLRVEGVLGTLRRGEYSTNTIEEIASYLLDVYIPNDRENEDTVDQKIVRENAQIAPETVNAPLFTEQEVAKAVRTFKNNKAPGPDLIEVCVLKAACKVIPGQIVRLFNGCLQWGVFPSIWKEGSLRVLLKSEDKDEKDPKSYRSICLLSVVGKLFEKILKIRLTATSLVPKNVSGRQFGFTLGKSTEDAIVELWRIVYASEERYAIALLFDISEAFDNVWWPLILDSLKNRNCPKNVFEVLRSYFSDQRVQLDIGHSRISKQATRGCPQGSVLGPACRNLIFDGLLRELEILAPGRFAAYADDLIALKEMREKR